MKAKCEHGADAVCSCGECYCSECFPGEACPDCMRPRDFEGLDAQPEYLEFVNSLPGGTVSPGGVGAMLGISRQAVHELMMRGKMRFWRFYTRGLERPEMVHVSIRDVVAYGVKSGRIKSYEDFGLGGYLVRQEYDRLKSLD